MFQLHLCRLRRQRCTSNTCPDYEGPGGSAVQGTHGHVAQGRTSPRAMNTVAPAHSAGGNRVHGQPVTAPTAPRKNPRPIGPQKESGQSKSGRCPRKLRERPDYHCPLAVYRPHAVCVNSAPGIVALSPIQDPSSRLPQPASRRIATPGAFRPSRGGLVASAAARGSRAGERLRKKAGEVSPDPFFSARDFSRRIPTAIVIP